MNNAQQIVEILIKSYPDARCELDFSTPFELLVAVILSAQCTDKRVNEVTKSLFKDFGTPSEVANADVTELENQIRSCGFYHNKAKNLIACAKSIMENYNGQVPETIEKLVTLGGVGRKTANVVFAEAFGGDAIAVDTHVFRVSNRIGIANAKTPEETELQLMETLPKNLWTKAHHAMIFHGRYTCRAKKPACAECPVKNDCLYKEKNL